MNKKVKILLSLIAIMMVVVYLTVTSAFIADKSREQRCKSINVKIVDAEKRSFVTESDVKSILLNSENRILGEPVHSLNIYKLEEVLRSKSLVEQAAVFTTIDGDLNVTIHQRKAVVRINTQGSGFYIDKNGFVFPLTKSYTDYVPVVTGNVPLPFSIGYKGMIPDKKDAIFLKKLLDFSLAIQDDPFWDAMVEQINVVSENEVEIVPRIGSHVVSLGSIDNYEYKLHKLVVFYQNAMPTVGWNKYKSINLAFSNQVICK